MGPGRVLRNDWPASTLLRVGDGGPADGDVNVSLEEDRHEASAKVRTREPLSPRVTSATHFEAATPDVATRPDVAAREVQTWRG